MADRLGFLLTHQTDTQSVRMAMGMDDEAAMVTSDEN